MRRGHHKTSLNNHQRHHLVKMMSIISLVFLLAHIILSPIGQHVHAEKEPEEVKVHGVKFENPNDIEGIEAIIIYKKTGVEKERFPMSKDNGNKIHGYTINDKSEYSHKGDFEVTITITWKNGEKTVFTPNHESSSSGNVWNLKWSGQDFKMPEVNPAFTIEKTADEKQYLPGETVTYTIVVTNTGDKALTNIQVKDEMIGLDDVIKELGVNKSETFTVEYTVKSDDIGELKNTATASVEVNGKTITHDASVIVKVVDPRLSLEKTVDKEEALVGDTVTYTIIVTNTGDKALTNVQVKDEMIGLNGVIKELGVNKSETFTVEYTVKSYDIGELKNTAIASVEVNGKTITAEDSVIVQVVNPSLSVEKTVDKEEALVGDTVTYTIVVTNTGDKALTNVQVKDEMIDLETVIEKLAVNESKTLTGEYVVTANDIGELKNTATASVKVNGKTIAAEDSVIVKVVDPRLSVEKTVDKEEALVGDTVTYTIVVTNTGDKALTNVQVKDEMIDFETVIEKLAVNASETFTGKYLVTEDDIGELKNTATASVKVDGETITAEDSVIVKVLNPSLAIEKTADKMQYLPGETVMYTIVVTNTGDKALTNILVKDDMIGLNTVIDQLAVNESKTLTGEYVVTANDVGNLTNIATATVKVNGKTFTDKDSVTVAVKSPPVVVNPNPPVVVNPSLSVEKTADKETYTPGETVKYTIEVTNNGNVTLSNVTLEDVFSADNKLSNDQLKLDGYTRPFTLGVNETKEFTSSYVIPIQQKAGTVYKNAIVAKAGNTSDEDECVVTVQENPSLSVEKTADKTQYLPGETVTYTIKVTNDGNVDLKGITLDDVFSKNGVVADQQLKVEGYEGAFDLAVGETLSFTSKFVIPEDVPADTTFKNVVTIKTGDISIDIFDEAVIVVDPTYAFTIEKTVDKKEATVGETVTYSIVITNTGNKALTNIHVKDDMIGLDTVIDQLDVNESRTLLGEYVVTAEDIGKLENIATATVEVEGETITHDASVIVEVSEKAEAAVDANDQVINTTQNPQTGDTTINTLLVLSVFVLAGSGLYIYRRKYRV